MMQFSELFKRIYCHYLKIEGYCGFSEKSEIFEFDIYFSEFNFEN
jgi:hypothetical protein